MVEDWTHGGFGLYIHWPFCEAKCPYCDFNSHVAREIDQSRWNRAYLEEIDRYRELLPGRVLNSIFFGGGTPSLMSPETVSSVITAVKKAWPISNDLEVTLEANPGSVEAGRFAAYADAGVNRVSMGIQALNDRDLRALGRLHSAQNAVKAFDVAKRYFERVSFDLIYARQDQTLEDWQRELSEALSMSVDHLSLYQLTIEPGTAFGDRYAVGKLRGLPPVDTAVDMYELTQDLTSKVGMPAYEVSNHAIPGAESRHNLMYWRYGDYIGIGPGAHGRITVGGRRLATEAHSNPARWLNSINTGTSEKPVRELSPADQAAEYVMMGLRINQGISIDRYHTISGAPLSHDTILHLKDIGMVEIDGSQLFTTAAGRMVLNSVIEALLP